MDSKSASVYYLAGTLFNKGIAFITVPIFTRILTMEDYGIVTTYNSWSAIMGMMFSLALYMSIRTSFVDFEKEKCDFLSTILLFTLSYGLTISIIIYFFSYMFFSYWVSSIVLLCVLQALGGALLESVSQYLMMHMNYKFRTAIMILPGFLSTIIAYIVIKYIISTELYMGRIVPLSVITLFFGIGVSVYFLPQGKMEINKTYLKYALRISLPLILHGLALNILSQSDRTMITMIADYTQTGIYGLIYNYSMISIVITNALDGVWVPFFMNCMMKREYNQINRKAVEYIKLITVAMIIVILIGPEMIMVMAPSSYWEGFYIIPPIVLANFLIFIYTFYANVEHFYKKTLFISINTLIAAIVNIILNYFFISWWGYIGAAYSTFISYLFSLTLHYIYSVKLNKDVLPIMNVLIPILTLISICVVYYLFIEKWYIRWGSVIFCLIMFCFKEKQLIIDFCKKDVS